MLKEMLLREVEQAMAKTRTTLERVPEEQFGFKPHVKSPTLGWLATHVADVPGWGKYTLMTETLDLTGVKPPEAAASRQAILDRFDRNLEGMREVLGAATEEALLAPWSLIMNGKTMFTMPRIDVLRTHVLNHMIHHRAQLGVYLRLNDVPVPALFGPSADEGSFG